MIQPKQSPSALPETQTTILQKTEIRLSCGFATIRILFDLQKIDLEDSKIFFVKLKNKAQIHKF
jgi:hypothetical protein